eukprot:2691338-Pyramimonas_sp.AAC.1
MEVVSRSIHFRFNCGKFGSEFVVLNNNIPKDKKYNDVALTIHYLKPLSTTTGKTVELVRPPLASALTKKAIDEMAASLTK